MEKKHWWSPLILGILVLALGIVILIFPQASYLTMTLLFGIVIALSGIMYIGLSFSKEVKGRGWLIVSGIVEIFLGIFFKSVVGTAEAAVIHSGIIRAIHLTAAMRAGEHSDFVYIFHLGGAVLFF